MLLALVVLLVPVVLVVFLLPVVLVALPTTRFQPGGVKLDSRPEQPRSSTWMRTQGRDTVGWFSPRNHATSRIKEIERTYEGMNGSSGLVVQAALDNRGTGSIPVGVIVETPRKMPHFDKF